MWVVDDPVAVDISVEDEEVEGEVGADDHAAKGVGDRAPAEDVLSQALGRLFALAEAYPDLKANQNMMQLSEELTSTENKISFARQAYNDSATTYNVYKKQFPPVFFAGLFDWAPVWATLEREYDATPVFLSVAEAHGFYEGLSNSSIWPPGRASNRLRLASRKRRRAPTAA